MLPFFAWKIFSISFFISLDFYLQVLLNYIDRRNLRLFSGRFVDGSLHNRFGFRLGLFFGSLGSFLSFGFGVHLRFHLTTERKTLFALASLDNRGKEYDYTFVHMGGLRPFGDEYFLRDGLTGYGGKPEKEFYLKTGTPTLAQYLVFVADEEKVTFYIRNTGSEPGYTPSDKPKPYVVYYQKPRG